MTDITWHDIFIFGAAGETEGAWCECGNTVAWHNSFCFCSRGQAAPAPGGGNAYVLPYYCCMVTCCA